MSEEKNADIVLSVKDVSVSYRTVKPIKLKKLIVKGKASEGKKKKVFQALKSISFDVFRGEVVGIIGKNGSGKSTLLRAIANIYEPDSGTINTFGNSVCLMAIGIGFVKELSGRDNIYLSGLLMGMTKNEIDGVIQEIIDFSELGDFIDEPVESYSSGMHSKLAFSISTTLQSDIILIDETLSVGDQRFKKKSKKKLLSLIQNKDKTVLIVSHNLATLSSLCKRVIWIDEGIIKMDGPCEDVLATYVEAAEK